MKEGEKVYIDFARIPELEPIVARHEALGEGRGFALLQLVSASLGLTNVVQGMRLLEGGESEAGKILREQVALSNMAIVLACRAFGLTQEEWELAGNAIFAQLLKGSDDGGTKLH